MQDVPKTASICSETTIDANELYVSVGTLGKSRLGTSPTCMLSSDTSEASNEAFGTIAATRPSQASWFKDVNVASRLDMSLELSFVEVDAHGLPIGSRQRHRFLG